MVLSEQFVQDSFHGYLKSSLAQAKAERLLDADVLSSAEGDLMITGPALCLYFAALRCTTHPPSVPLPRATKTSEPLELSQDNCPQAFVPFLQVWGKTVPVIQGLIPEAQHDLARVICGLEPLNNESTSIISGIAADLRAVAIEISQRRSFQDRYASDLQAALDAGTPSPRKASFVPPPSYDEAPRGLTESSIPYPSLPSPSASSFTSSESHATTSMYERSRTPSLAYSQASHSSQASLIPADSPIINIIRETLYAAVADVIAVRPEIRLLLKRDPPRAYFSAVAFAILNVSTSPDVDTRNGSIRSILGEARWLTLEECPRELQPFMRELGGIGREAKTIEEEDTQYAIECIQTGAALPSETRLDRAMRILEKGVGYNINDPSGRRSPEGRAVAFANRINALALGMTKLRAFRERQDEVFKVLAGAR